MTITARWSIWAKIYVAIGKVENAVNVDKSHRVYDVALVDSLAASRLLPVASPPPYKAFIFNVQTSLHWVKYKCA